MKRALISMSIYFAGILAGFLFVSLGFSKVSHSLITFSLIVLMTLSIKNIHLGIAKIEHIGTIAQLLGLSYLLIPTIYGIIMYFFVPESIYQNALIVLAFMPPAIAIVTLTFILNGDTRLGLITEFAGFGVTLALMPIVSKLLFSVQIPLDSLLRVLILVMIIPLFLAKGIHIIEMKTKTLSKKATHTFIDISLSLLFFAVVVGNAHQIIDEPQLILRFLLIFLFAQFGLAYVLYVIVKRMKNKNTDILFVLFGSFKNGGGALAVVALIFGLKATLPLTVQAILTPFFIIFIERLFSDRIDMN